MKSFYTNIFQRGNTIYLRGFEDGERIQKKYKYEPYLFVPDKKMSNRAIYYDIHGAPMKQVNFDSINEAKDFVKSYAEVDGMQICGYDRWQYMFLYDNFKDMDYDSSMLNIVGLDIEVESDDGFPEPDSASKEITAITLRRGDMKIAIGCGDFSCDDKNVYYMKCDNEIHLLRKFLQVWENLDVDVLTGWNTEFFDIPYIVNRINQLLGEEHSSRLSPWGLLREYSITLGTKEQRSYDILGISCLDYLAVYKKFQLAPRESYRLDNIAEVELGEKKIDYSEYGNLYTLHKENYQKFIEYNIRDVDLIFMLEEKLGFLDQLFALTYDSRVNFSEGLSSLVIWDTIIHNYLLDKNIVVPTARPHISSDHTIAGGFVKEPVPGMYEWVMSFDLNSLYPHLIMQYNISPDTKLYHVNDDLLECRMSANVDSLLDRKMNNNALIDSDCTMTPNGQFYKKNFEGFLPALMKKMYNGRVEYKRRMIEGKKELEEIDDELRKRGVL